VARCTNRNSKNQGRIKYAKQARKENQTPKEAHKEQEVALCNSYALAITEGYKMREKTTSTCINTCAIIDRIPWAYNGHVVFSFVNP